MLAGLTLTDAERARVHTPVGLPIGARTAPEIALSILAEIVRERRLGSAPVPARPAEATAPAADHCCPP